MGKKRRAAQPIPLRTNRNEGSSEELTDYSNSTPEISAIPVISAHGDDRTIRFEDITSILTDEDEQHHDVVNEVIPEEAEEANEEEEATLTEEIDWYPSCPRAEKIWREGRYLTRDLKKHHSAVTCLDCSDRYIVSGSIDCTATVWKLDSLTEMKSFGEHRDGVNCVKILDEEKVASGGGDGVVFVWTLAKCKTLRKLHVLSPVHSILPLDNNLYVGSTDGHIRCWENSNDNVAHVLRGHKGAVLSLSSTASNQLVSSSADGTIRVWESDECVNVHKGDSGSIYCLAVANNNIFYGDMGGDVKSWTPPNNSHHLEYSNHSLPPMGPLKSIHLQGSVMVAGGQSISAKKAKSKLGVVQVRVYWLGDIGNPEPLHYLTYHRGSVDAIAGRGSLLVTGGSDGRVIVIDADPDRPDGAGKNRVTEEERNNGFRIIRGVQEQDKVKFHEPSRRQSEDHLADDDLSDLDVSKSRTEKRKKKRAYRRAPVDALKKGSHSSENVLIIVVFTIFALFIAMEYFRFTLSTKEQ